MLFPAAIALAIATAAAWTWRHQRASVEPLFPAGSSVLLVTIDTLRPDALGFVAGRNETPVIDELASTGIRFSGAIAPVPLTLPSHTTMMTGVLPVRHGIHVNGQALGESVPTLAERFRAHGHATGAFVSTTVLKKDFGLGRGFDVYDDSATPMDDRLMSRRAAQTVAAARAWIGQQGDKPWFVWVHLYDAHTPYDPPRIFWKPGERGAYDGAVGYIDNALRPLLETARDTAGSTLLTILTSDHGEAFGEHDEIEHGIFIYDTTMRVPLVIAYPGVLVPAAPAFTPRLVDLVPTLVHGFGWEPALKYDGVSLVPGLRGEPLEVPPAYIESEFPWTSYGWAPLRGVQDGDWKFISAPEDELYRLATDPGEAHNLAKSQPARVASMTMWLDRTRLEPPIASAGRIDDMDTLARLQSLGYVGAGSSIGPAPEGRADPKTRTRMRESLRDATALARRGKVEEALSLYDTVLAEEPDNRYALARSGSLALQHGDLPLAIRRLQVAVAQAPGQSDVQFALADALTRAQRYEEALPQWMEAVRQQPTKSQAWSNLGSTAIWAGDPQRAIVAYQQALALVPDDPAILGNLGEAERSAGRKADAVAHLIAAAEREGATTRRAARIGMLLADLGRDDESAAWLARSRPGDDDFAAAQVRFAVHLVATDPAAARRALAAACRADPAQASRAHADAALRTVADACFSSARTPAERRTGGR